MAEAKTRRDFFALSGVAGLGLLVGCGSESRVVPEDISRSTNVGNLGGSGYDAWMRRNGLVAVSEGMTQIVRSDMHGNVDLARHLAVVSGLTPFSERQPGGGGGGDSPTPRPSASPTDSPSCASGHPNVGDTCGGLKVIAVDTSVNSFALNTYAGGFDSWSAGFSVGGIEYLGPRYTFNKFLQCIESEFTDVKNAMSSLAEQLTVAGGSALLKYFKAGSIQAVLNAAKGLLAGTVSWLGLWDVVVAALSLVSLPELLEAAGIGLGVAVLFGAVRCAAQ